MERVCLFVALASVPLRNPMAPYKFECAVSYFVLITKLLTEGQLPVIQWLIRGLRWSLDAHEFTGASLSRPNIDHPFNVSSTFIMTNHLNGLF